MVTCEFKGSWPNVLNVQSIWAEQGATLDNILLFSNNNYNYENDDDNHKTRIFYDAVLLVRKSFTSFDLKQFHQ